MWFSAFRWYLGTIIELVSCLLSRSSGYVSLTNPTPRPTDLRDARNLRVMQHLQAMANAAMTRKWLAVEAALAKLDVSSTVVVELRVKDAMVTINTCSLVELLNITSIIISYLDAILCHVKLYLVTI
jgi:hypothetical protein